MRVLEVRERSRFTTDAAGERFVRSRVECQFFGAGFSRRLPKARISQLVLSFDVFIFLSALASVLQAASHARRRQF